MARTQRERNASSRRYAYETDYSKHTEYLNYEENEAYRFGLRTYGEDVVKFHKRHWDEIDIKENPITELLSWCDNKSDIGHAFRNFYRRQINEHLEKIGDEPDPNNAEKAQTLSDTLDEKLNELGFTEAKSSKSYDKKYTHKLKVNDLKDLFRRKLEPHYKEELKEYTEYVELRALKVEDCQSREVFTKRVQFFHAFVSLFEDRKKAYTEDIERIQLSIGKGHYESLAGPRDSRSYGLYPEHARTSAFRALNYATEWLKVYNPIINEIERLKTALNAPDTLNNMGWDNSTFTKWHHVDIIKLANFDYQGFLTFLLDFRQRFGKKERGEKQALSGWRIYERDQHSGGYQRSHYGADEWDVFECSLNLDGYSGTINEILNQKLETGQIYTISSAGRMAEIVEHTNHEYHKKNDGLGRYERTPLIRVKVSDEKDADAGRWKL